MLSLPKDFLSKVCFLGSRLVEIEGTNVEGKSFKAIRKKIAEAKLPFTLRVSYDENEEDFLKLKVEGEKRKRRSERFFCLQFVAIVFQFRKAKSASAEFIAAGSGNFSENKHILPKLSQQLRLSLQPPLTSPQLDRVFLILKRNSKDVGLQEPYFSVSSDVASVVWSPQAPLVKKYRSKNQFCIFFQNVCKAIRVLFSRRDL